MIGSPTSESAQWRTRPMASAYRSGLTPGTPLSCFIIARWFSSKPSSKVAGSSTCQRNEVPTGLSWWRQQKTHLFAHASDGVASMHWYETMP